MTMRQLFPIPKRRTCACWRDWVAWCRRAVIGGPRAWLKAPFMLISYEMRARTWRRGVVSHNHPSPPPADTPDREYEKHTQFNLIPLHLSVSFYQECLLTNVSPNYVCLSFSEMVTLPLPPWLHRLPHSLGTYIRLFFCSSVFITHSSVRSLLSLWNIRQACYLVRGACLTL